MAKATATTGTDGQVLHTRTTGDSTESQAVVIAIDGSDSVVDATSANGLEVDVTRVQGTVTVADSAVASALSTLSGYVDGLEGKDYATQTTLAAVLAKLIAAPATEAKQDTANTSLASILSAVDGLEGFTDGLETINAAVRDRLPSAVTTEGALKVDDREIGTWGYQAGVSGTETITSGVRVLSIACKAGGSGATVTIAGGDSITVPANDAWGMEIHGRLVAPAIVFTGTVSYVVETAG